MRSTLRRVLSALLLVVTVAAPVAAGDLVRESRIEGLERSLSRTRARLHEAPRRTAYDLRRAGDRLRSLAIRPSERSVAVERLERGLTDLRHDADRVERRARLARPRGGDPTAPPASFRPPYPADIRGIERLIGVGKQVVLVQRSLRSSARELAAARRALAARHLARAEGDLARLAGLGRDPTLDALRLEARRLRQRLGAP